MANYCVGLRDYPREVAGWILAPATLTMTARPPDHLVSPPGAAALLAAHWRPRLRRLPVVDVLRGQLHSKKKSPG
jgi:hypothetical protein